MIKNKVIPIKYIYLKFCIKSKREMFDNSLLVAPQLTFLQQKNS